MPSNITPMMATSARLMSFLRTMLVPAEDAEQEIYLLSALSPACAEEGRGDRSKQKLLTSFGTTPFR